jgi:hypothetical protein
MPFVASITSIEKRIFYTNSHLFALETMGSESETTLIYSKVLLRVTEFFKTFHSCVEMEGSWTYSQNPSLGPQK